MGSMAILGIVALILAVWITVKGINLVIRSFCRRPRNFWLWFFLISGIGATVVTILTRGNPIAAVAAVLCLIALVITARIIDILANDLFQKQPEPLLTSVLRKPWWDSGKDVKAA